MASESDLYEKRQNRIEDAIERLTEISSDLNKMIAVHEQRITQQEKQTSFLGDILERRREESEVKLKEVYDTIRSEDRNILEEISTIKIKMNKIEKMIWMYLGGVGVVVFLINYGPALMKILGK